VRVLSEDEVQRRAALARRQTHQRHAREEEHKRATVDRLLRKQESKKLRVDADAVERRARLRRAAGPTLLYVQSQRDGTRLSLPAGIAWAPFPPPASVLTPSPTPPLRLCARPGCGQPRRYVHRAAQVPICSLACYAFFSPAGH
jgi:INO80 complex subunit B